MILQNFKDAELQFHPIELTHYLEDAKNLLDLMYEFVFVCIDLSLVSVFPFYESYKTDNPNYLNLSMSLTSFY